MTRAILAGGGVGLLGVFAGFLYFFVAWTAVRRSADKRSSHDGWDGRAGWRDRQLVLCPSMAARFILDHNDCRMDFGFQRVSNADRGGAIDLRKVRYYLMARRREPND